MREILRVTWTVTPLHPPQAWRHCSHCRMPRRFTCSGKFRANAQKKRIDVWLIYRCAACGDSWNLPIIARAAVTKIDAADLVRFMNNDQELAMQHAFDMQRLRCHAQRIETCSDFSIAKTCASGHRSAPTRIAITLALRGSSHVRLDLLLSRELNLSRSRIARLAADGLLGSVPETRKGISSPIVDGQVITLDVSQFDRETVAALTRAALTGASRASP